MPRSDDDQRIDEALRLYVPTVEPPGLRLRIEQRVSDRTSSNRKLFRISALGAVAAAILLVVSLTRMGPPSLEHDVAKRIKAPPVPPGCCVPPPVASAHSVPLAAPVAAFRKAPNTRSSYHLLPKLAQFPMPSALNEEERNLRRVPTVPAAAQLLEAANLAAQTESVKPIQIDPL